MYFQGEEGIMSLNNLHLTPMTGLAQGLGVGARIQLEGARLTPSAWAILDAFRLILDLMEQTIIVDRSTGEILNIIESDGLTLLGMSRDKTIAVFSSDLSWDNQLYRIDERSWSQNEDPDFPRFVLEEDEHGASIIDLEIDERITIEQLLPYALRRTA